MTIIIIDFASALNIYNHEEGHHFNDLVGPTVEFGSMFNEIFKKFILIAMVSEEISKLYFDGISDSAPTSLDTGWTIKEMGKYTAGSLMFFYVVKKFNGNLADAARFVFFNDEATLEKFFYNKLKNRDKKLTLQKVWLKEATDVLQHQGLQNYVKNLPDVWEIPNYTEDATVN